MVFHRSNAPAVQYTGRWSVKPEFPFMPSGYAEAWELFKNHHLYSGLPA